jgi:hypothetical protein
MKGKKNPSKLTFKQKGNMHLPMGRGNEKPGFSHYLMFIININFHHYKNSFLNDKNKEG